MRNNALFASKNIKKVRIKFEMRLFCLIILF